MRVPRGFGEGDGRKVVEAFLHKDVGEAFALFGAYVEIGTDPSGIRGIAKPTA